MPRSLQTSFYPMSYSDTAPRLLSAGEVVEAVAARDSKRTL